MKYDPRTALKSDNGKNQQKYGSFTLKKTVSGPADPGIDDTAVIDHLQPYGSQNKKTSGLISTKNKIERKGNDKTSPGVIKLKVQDKVHKLS